MTTVLTTRSGRVLEITLNRPEVRNALNLELTSSLTEVLTEADADGDISVVLLTGAGPAFCAGADLNEISATTFAEMSARVDRSLRLYQCLAGLRKPIIAAVNGPAVAGGCGVAMACDLVIASDTAKFGYPEVRRGLVAAFVMVTLERLIGRRKALELLITGRFLDAIEARELGMANEVVPSGQTLARARQIATEIAVLDPTAVSISKDLFNRIGQMSMHDGLLAARETNLLVRQLSSAIAGATSFVKGEH